MPLVTLEEAKLWLRVDGDNEDSLIDALIDEAEEYLLAATGRTWEGNRRARRFVLAYVTDAYENRGLQPDSRYVGTERVVRVGQPLSRALQSIILQLQLEPEPEELGL